MTESKSENIYSGKEAQYGQTPNSRKATKTIMNENDILYTGRVFRIERREQVLPDGRSVSREVN